MYGSRQRPGLCPREAVLWLAVRHRDRGALKVFSGEIAPAGTGMGEGEGRKVRWKYNELVGEVWEGMTGDDKL